MKKSKSKEAVSIGSSTIQEKNPGTVPEEEDLETEDVLTQAPTTSMESSPARPRTQQQKAGIIFPVLRIKKYLKNGKLTNNLWLVFPAIDFSGNYKVNNTMKIVTPIYLAAVLEYLTAEVLEISGNAAKSSKRNTIKPRHLLLAIRNDEEINKLLSNVTISEGGVVPGIHPFLIPKKHQ